MTKESIKAKEQKLIEVTIDFCKKYLDDDYVHLCEKCIRKLGRKRHVPFETGKIEIWAASIIHALGSINFLFDKSFEPFINYDVICEHFSTKKIYCCR